MRWPAWLLLVTLLAGCAEKGPFFKWEPLDQDPGVRAGSHGGTAMGRGAPKSD